MRTRGPGLSVCAEFVLALCLLIMPAQAQMARNLLPNASFEAPVAPPFSIRNNPYYYAARIKSAQAPAGDYVLAIQGWHPHGTKIFTEPINISGTELTATVRLRSVALPGPPVAPGATIELAVFEEQGNTRLATAAMLKLEPGTAWKTLAGTMTVPPGTTRVRLALMPGGPQQSLRLEVDQAGLFAGPDAGLIADSSSWTWFEAENMEVGPGKAWTARDHFSCGIPPCLPTPKCWRVWRR